MHIHVSTASEHLRDFTERLPELFDREGEVLHAGRNTIKAFEAEGERLVVKRFKRPNLLRAVIYTFFRRSKARRSYEHAVRLIFSQKNTVDVWFYGLFRYICQR